MCETQHLDMIKPSSCKPSYCNFRRKVGRKPTFPTPGPTNSLGTCLFMYNGVFMTFMLICHDPSTLRPPGRECSCSWDNFFQVHAKFHDCVQVMSSCHVFAFCGNLPRIHIFTSFIMNAGHLAYTSHHVMLGIWLL